MRRLAGVVLLGLIAVAAAACGDQSQVGSQKLLQFTPPPPATASPTPPAPPVATHAPQPAPTKSTAPAPPPPQVYVVAITSASPYFNPPSATVSHGTIVKWVNQDSQPDYIEIVGVARSPQIAPGGSWSFTFANRGSFQYTDRRPYANGMVTST